MKKIMMQGMISLGSVFVVLGLAGCSSSGGGGGDAAEISPAGTVVHTLNWQDGTIKEDSSPFVVDYQKDQNGNITSAKVQYGSTTINYDNCAVNEEGDIECFKSDNIRDSVVTIKRKFGSNNYEHLEVVEWECDNGSQAVRAVTFKGNETPVADMPKNVKATYSGDVELSAVATYTGQDGVRTSVFDAEGRATYNVDFGSGKITGAFTDFKYQGTASSMPGQVDISGSIKDNTFTVDSISGNYGSVHILSGSGSGKFFGPNATELGGSAAFEAACVETRCNGQAVFTGKQDSQPQP